MKIVKFCAVLNVFVFFAIQGIGSEDQAHEADLSVRSRKLYDLLPNEDSKTVFLQHCNEKRSLMEENCKLRSEKGYSEFMCAASKLKSQTERIFPDFGKWINGTNPRFNRFMKRFFVRNPLNGEVKRFQKIEADEQVKQRHRVDKKMFSFHRQMYAMLKRYALPEYEGCITNDSYHYAEKILEGIIRFPLPKGGFDKIMEDFCHRYAHIRHCFNFFGHHQIAVIDEVMEDLTKALKEKARKIDICQLLEHMGILELWQFTQDDIDAMNVMSYARMGKRIYRPYPCYCRIGENTIEVLIPLTAVENCPVFLEVTSSTSTTESTL